MKGSHGPCAQSMFAFVVLLTTLCVPIQAAEMPQIEPQVKKELTSYLKSHYMTPEDYVISKFKDHDIVILGEMHRIKHDPELVQALIPLLHKRGIYTLAMEVARREEQPMIDKLLNAPEYDEALARRIQFNMMTTWGFREYVDIYKAAWRLNHSLPKGARKFRILGLTDSMNWSLIKTEKDAADPEIRRKVLGNNSGEDQWAKVIMNEVVAKKEKALVYCGIHHGFSKYQQPIYDEQNRKFVRFVTDRMGNHLFRAVGDRVMTIYLHAPWVPAEGYSAGFSVHPVDGVIDTIMTLVEPRYRRVGFDTHGTPFGRLPGSSFYKHGYEDFTLEVFCDGYIFQKPLGEYQGVTPIPGFINEVNIEQARTQSPDLAHRSASIEDLNREIAEDAASGRVDIKTLR